MFGLNLLTIGMVLDIRTEKSTSCYLKHIRFSVFRANLPFREFFPRKGRLLFQKELPPRGI